MQNCKKKKKKKKKKKNPTKTAPKPIEKLAPVLVVESRSESTLDHERVRIV
jgi:hypothetical protein